MIMSILSILDLGYWNFNNVEDTQMTGNYLSESRTKKFEYLSEETYQPVHKAVKNPDRNILRF